MHKGKTIFTLCFNQQNSIKLLSVQKSQFKVTLEQLESGSKLRVNVNIFAGFYSEVDLTLN